MRNGSLEVPELQAQAISASEAATGATASGVDLSDIDIESFREVALTHLRTCSMLQDIMAGRKTEVNHLWGHCRCRKSVGVPTPRNEMLHALICGIEII